MTKSVQCMDEQSEWGSDSDMEARLRRAPDPSRRHLADYTTDEEENAASSADGDGDAGADVKP